MQMREEKKRHYNERVLQVENGSFTPLVFSVYGGMGQECQHFFRRLCGLIADKRDQRVSEVTTWLRTKTSFALLRSALMCIRGTRYRYYKDQVEGVDVELVNRTTFIRPM